MSYEILSKPEEIYSKMLNDINLAKKEILLETYIYGNDKTGRMFREALIKKAKEGIKIKLLIDSWGSSAKKHFFKELINLGAEVRYFKKLVYAFKIIGANHERNHRKLLLIDNQISYIGSINITSEGLDWVELVLRFDEEISLVFRRTFYHSWKRFNKDFKKRMRNIIHKNFKIIQDSPHEKHRYIENSYRKIILKAKKEILIETPYFIPSPIIRYAIRKAIKKGVKIKIILPENSDKIFMDLIRNNYLGRLYRNGVKIYFYPKILHSKLLIADDKYFLLGSSNLDHRSFIHQFEINLLGEHEEINTALKEYFVKHLSESKKFNYKIWKQRKNFKKFLEFFLNKVEKYF